VTTRQYKKNMQTIKDNISAIASRAALASKAGKSFAGKRDVYETLGYTRLPNFTDYLARYDRDSIAGRIVDAPALATWRQQPQVIASEEFTSAWDSISTRLKLIHRVERADRLSGIGRYGVLVIGTRGSNDLSTQISKTRSPDDILYLSAYSEGTATISKIESSPASPRFGLPVMYSISVGTNTAGFDSKTLKVHHSRVIHIAEGLLEDDIYGRPRLERVFNLMDDLAKVVGGSAEFFWRIADRGMQFDLDKDMDLSADDEAKMDDQIQEYIHGLRRVFQTRGVTAKVLGSEIADPRGPFNTIMSLISGATGIPMRILTGSERGQLASSQDRANWMERISERAASYAEPIILRPLIDRFIAIGALPSEAYTIKWPVLESLTESERAENAQRISSAALNIARQRSLGEETITIDEFRRKWLDLPEKKDILPNMSEEKSNEQ